eukprot:CAMPEP_0203909218 /NCGR_PEP_ID=MMETSP0359-20131031/50545_1 /ASSEMBLY_ACC=CAM_ASM_000338 /TAXON_ID=268821 /ORGANISM="Scrippsiella Hangoei, Strain SHTV-5" /LENGTH=84 /DNA_ID=CAMNT_0050834407 /DNA_START=24 /DNA_END=275 /DNA_ORIENTATION=+
MQSAHMLVRKQSGETALAFRASPSSSAPESPMLLLSKSSCCRVVFTLAPAPAPRFGRARGGRAPGEAARGEIGSRLRGLAQRLR